MFDYQLLVTIILSILGIFILGDLLSKFLTLKKLKKGPVSTVDAKIDNITNSFGRGRGGEITYTFSAVGMIYSQTIKVSSVKNMKTLENAKVIYLNSDPDINILCGFEDTLFNKYKFYSGLFSELIILYIIYKIWTI